MFRPIPSVRSAATAACALFATATPALAGGETITVTTLEDDVDAASPSLGDLPGPDGVVSFREALAVVNHEPGPQTVEFAIPKDEWWLFDDRALLRLEDGTFVVTDDETTIDFTSQTDFTGDTNPDGWEVGIYGLQPNAWGVTAIRISSDDCLVLGLDRVLQRGYGVALEGDRNRVVSCTISGPLYAGVRVQGPVGSPAMDNVVGGTAPGEGNELSAGNAGVRIDGPTDGTVVVGNTLVGSSFAGVQVRGAFCCPQYTPFDTRIGGPSPEERNWIADNGSFGEEGFPVGDQVQVEFAVDTLVEGNYIGTTEAGDAAFPGAHGTAGVSVQDSETTVIRGNLISGIRKEGVNHHAGEVYGAGIDVLGPNTGIEIQGNLVGTDAAGQTPVPNLDGISFSWFQGYASGGQIGGAAEGEGNTVAFNERHGILVASGVVGVTIRANSIHDNGQLGIDLASASGGTGVTPNDGPGDADTGANGLQNFPVVDSATSAEGAVEVEGTLQSMSDRTYTIDFFASDACDPSGNGEGARHLGSIDVVTDARGEATFDASLSATAEDGEVVTATATDVETGSTSEFSACVPVEAGFVDIGFGLAGVAGVPQLVGDGSMNAGEATTLELTGAKPAAAAVLVAGLSDVHLPVAGGTLVPSPDALVPLVIGAAGDATFTAPWPASVGPGASLYFQEWIVDPAAPEGFSASNAVVATVP